jgi:hypothetical protein
MSEPDVAAARKQLEKALAAVPELTPASVAVFGGVVDPSALHFPFNRMEASDARDWDAIRTWSGTVAGLGRDRIEAASV